MPQSLSLDAPVTVLPGIGTKKAELYKKLGIYTLRQLLLHLPRKYMDLRAPTPLDEVILNDDVPHLICATVFAKSSKQLIRRGLSVFHLRAEADGIELIITYFNAEYQVKSIPVGEKIYFYGSVGGTLLKREMTCPEVISKNRIGYFSPVYSKTAGLSSNTIAHDIENAMRFIGNHVTDALPDNIAEKYGLCALDEALHSVHRPKNEGDIEPARRRITFAALYSYSAAMLTLRGMHTRKTTKPFICTDAAPFLQSLPYSPTNAQHRAIYDICRDFESGNIMNRLIEGDVGCGKTLIAAAAIYCSAKSGFQSAMMVPTEILAEQHMKTLSAMLEPFGIRVDILTSSLSTAHRRSILDKTANCETDLLVGTHALFQSDVNLPHLGLIITDEQHRFGVAQRAALAAKGEDVHTLVMSATPIPRTMSLIVYGDLDISVVDEMPAGRQKVATYCIDSGKRERALGYLRRHLDAGLQGYIVCPIVEEGENTPDDIIDAVSYTKKLSYGVLSGYRIALLHGKMKPAEKDDIMHRFVSGEIQVLVSTTVIEVGVDVPNAAVMIIENAERFGLSQLHQLRGRVGRGKAQSCCILISNSKNEISRERFKIITSTNDGFKIAQEDLRLRGPGEILGTRQHGIPNIDLISEPQLLSAAQKAAAEVLHDDPILEHHQKLKNEVESILKNSEKTFN